MASSSEKQKHFMQMSLAIKHGHKIKGMSKEMNKKLHKTAEGMSEKSLHDFATMAVRKKKKA